VSNQYRYPFGRPVCPFEHSQRAGRPVFVLGAYPSALHVEWLAPNGEHVNALPVDNEPEPFWNGANERALVEAFKSEVRPVGQVTAPGLKWNGSSGVAMDKRYLEPLGHTRSDAWVSDCLNTYFASENVAKAILRAYEPAVQSHQLPPANLQHHPSEAEIVQRASQGERLQALRSEFRNTEPSVVITLGNAALLVLKSMLEVTAGSAKLTTEDYGIPVNLDLGRSVRWYALAHPGATREGRPYYATHEAWIERTLRDRA
jgi:hypothetical protein